MRAMGVMKISNDYASALGKFYADTPKAVFAALAYSFAHRLDGGEPAPAAIVAALEHEWLVLHQNGIVPQAPPAQVWYAHGIQPGRKTKGMR